jgi:hypothetical protein
MPRTPLLSSLPRTRVSAAAGLPRLAKERLPKACADTVRNSFSSHGRAAVALAVTAALSSGAILGTSAVAVAAESGPQQSTSVAQADAAQSVSKTVAPTSSPVESSTVKTSSSSSSSSSARAAETPQQIAADLVPASQQDAFAQVISHESGWDVTATNSSTGAYGLGQALPGSKMAAYGSDWKTNPEAQIKWALNYMDSRYGSPTAAWSFWQANGWY